MRLAADANVLLSALIRGRARLVLDHPKISEILTTEYTIAEVEEYIPIFARKRRLPVDVLILAAASLPVTVVDRANYAKKLPEALRRIGGRDPDDAELLAMALHHTIPVWSNDKDFTSASIELFNTEDLLRHLGVIE